MWLTDTVEMRTITSADGQVQTVSVRRSESADAQGISDLIDLGAVEVFGRINVIHLLEKANLAVTVANEQDDILAHASFFDFPGGDMVDQDQWEPFLHTHFSTEACTPVNTLFLHLFVAKPGFSTAALKEIMRAVFCVTVELEFVFLICSNTKVSDPALGEMFEPLQPLTNPRPPCSALICYRHNLFPRVHVRPARVEDHDDVMRMFAQQTTFLSVIDQPNFLTELIESQDEENHAAVCESEGFVTGFISITAEVDVKRLQESFDLSNFDTLYKRSAVQPPSPRERGGGEEGDDNEEEEEAWPSASQGALWSTGAGELMEKPNAFCIQFFVIDKSFETRSVDFIPYIFKFFPDLDFCIITVPTSSPEFPLLQSFLRVAPRCSSSLAFELYLFHRAGLRSVMMRTAVSSDRPAVCELVKNVRLNHFLLQDLDLFFEYRRDTEGLALQAFIAQADEEVVGILIIRDEQDMEYIRGHYNIENFIYFSHHRYEEHAQIRHLVLAPFFQHFSTHVFKDVLRLAHKSCLYHRGFPPGCGQENSCICHLDFVLDCAVPVRPRCQIIYPLEELGINVPSRRITEEQAPFALSLVSRKLTMEPKVTVNARIVVVGASDTGLSFLEVLCFCPHLRFNNLSLVSTHGFPGDHDCKGNFLSTSHAYTSGDLAQMPLHSYVTMITGKMVGINRKSKHLLLSSGGKVPYDHLVLCTGLQYQLPCPTGVDLTLPISSSQLQAPPSPSRYSGLVPSNLFTLNDLHDCKEARRWLKNNFVKRRENAIVYGNSIDVFTTVETLLGLGIQGSRVHLVLPPCEPGALRLGDQAVERAVTATMKDAGVHVHRRCLLAQMNHGENPDPLTSASFSTDSKPLHLPCGVFINLSNKGVDYDTFSSINNSFLVFDRRLVINSAFSTSDPAIYGAGPLTKFSRSYYSDEWSHGNFNSKEVGQDLAATILPLFDPTLEPADELTPEMNHLVPLYKHAKIQGGKLPGGFNYLHVTKPSASNQSPPGVKHHDIVTGRVETGNYFCLHLDSYERVETLTCLSLKPLPVCNYLSLFGKHEQLLGQLMLRYHQGLIHDLYSFFRQSWCLAIFHDRFSDFEQELLQISSALPEDSKSEGQVRPSDDKETKLVPQHGLEDLARRATLRSNAVKYLAYNRNLLPMFATPGQL